MSLTDYIYNKSAFFRFILLISVMFAQNCSNNERLEGFRKPVLEEQKFYETSKKGKKAKGKKQTRPKHQQWHETGPHGSVWAYSCTGWFPQVLGSLCNAS